MGWHQTGSGIFIQNAEQFSVPLEILCGFKTGSPDMT